MANNLFIAYDLLEPGQNYDDVRSACSRLRMKPSTGRRANFTIKCTNAPPAMRSLSMRGSLLGARR